MENKRGSTFAPDKAFAALGTETLVEICTPSATWPAAFVLGAARPRRDA